MWNYGLQEIIVLWGRVWYSVSDEEESSKIKAEMLFVIGRYESLVTLVSKIPYASEGRILMIWFMGYTE